MPIIITPELAKLGRKNLIDKAKKSGSKIQEGLAEKAEEIEFSNFIFDDEQIAQKIDHALGKVKINGNCLRYFGIRIPSKIKRNNGYDIKEVPAIILEDRTIISEKNKPENCNFEFDTKMNLKFNRWDKCSVKLFLKEKIKDISYKETYESFKKFYDENMVYENLVDYEINPLWDLLTYHFDLVDKSLIIKKEGISGSAKSKGMKISCNLSFNGRKWVKPNPANFFRYRNNNKATIYLEEAERLFDDTKRKQIGDDEIVEYINASYEKGNYVPRQNKDHPDLTDEFDPFGFTQIGSIKALKGALEKRSITQIMIKAKKGDKRGDTEIPTERDSKYSNVRAKAYISSLLHYKEFEISLSKVQNEFRLANREWSLARPLIALAYCIDKTLAFRVGDYLSSCFKIRDEVTDEKSWDIVLSNVLLSFACKGEGEVFVSNEFIRNGFNEQLSKLDSNSRPVSMIAISKISSELGLKNFRTRNSHGNERGINISFFKLCEILIRNDKTDIKEVINKVSEVSDCQYSLDKINKWYSDNFPDNIINNVSESLISDDTDTSDSDLGVSKKKEIIRFEDDDILTFIQERNNFYPLIEFVDKYGEDLYKRLKLEGWIAEHKSGFLSIVQPSEVKISE